MIEDLSAAETYWSALREPEQVRARMAFNAMRMRHQLRGLPTMAFIVIGGLPVVACYWYHVAPPWFSVVGFVCALAVSTAIHRVYVRPRADFLLDTAHWHVDHGGEEVRGVFLRIAHEEGTLAAMVTDLTRMF